MLKVEKLFRASEHNFSVTAFHEKCDNKEDTLVLVRTEFGKNIGGYTHNPWKSVTGDGEWVCDSGRKAFLFSLDMGEKFVPQGDERSIFRHSDFGPVFGSGDISISDCCNSNSKSCARFPCTFNRAGGNKLERKEDTWRMFSGTDAKLFKVEEYEVFRLFYQ